VKPDLTTAISNSGRVSVVALAGDHDLATASDLRRALADCSGSSLVLIDLAACTFIDSTVIGVLASAAKRLAAGGGELMTINPTGVTAKALDVTGATRVLHTTDTAHLGDAEALDLLAATLSARP
jgi:anti-sigma B factor antagonist